MRAVKVVGVVIGALVAVLVIAVVAIFVLVDPNDYRDDIEQLVERQTGRELAIGGELGLKVFPWLALQVGEVRLGNPPGYGPEPFLTVRRANVGVKLFPLMLSRRLEVSRVAIDGLEVHLVSRGEEDNNWKDLARSEAEQPPDEGAPQASVAGFDLTDSVLVYRDETEDSTIRLSGLEVHAGALGSDQPVNTSVEFDYDEGGGTPLAHVAARTTVHILGNASGIELTGLEVEGHWMGEPEERAAAPASGGARSRELPFSVRSDKIALDLENETLSPTTLQVRVRDIPLELTVRGEKLFTSHIIDGSVTLPEVSPKDLLRSFDIEVPETADPAALSRVSYKGELRLTERQLQLPSLELMLDESRLRGSAAIEDLETTALRFDLDLDQIDLDRYLAPETEGKGGSAKEEPPTELPLEALRELRARGLLKVGKATLAGLQFSEVHLPLQASAGRVRLGPTQARLFGGAYNGQIELDARGREARLSLNERAQGIDLGALMSATFETDRVEGRGDATAVLTGSGNTDAAILDSLAGQLGFDVKDGAIAGIDIWYELRRALALFKRQPPPAAPAGPPRTPFSTLRGTATLAGGVLRNEDLRAETEYLKASGKGTLSLKDNTIDYRLLAEVYRLPSGEAGTEVADLKAAEIPITITGTLEDMKVRPDVAGIVKSRVKKEVEEKKEELKEEIRKKLGDRLKGLFGD